MNNWPSCNQGSSDWNCKHVESQPNRQQVNIPKNSQDQQGKVQALHTPLNKRKMKILEELKDEEDLRSMTRKVATRFLLSKCHPDMTEGSVKRHVFKNFPIVSEVYVRKLTMRHDDYSSFVFIVNTDEELDVEIFTKHKWPGLIKCFFSPREQFRRY